MSTPSNEGWVEGTPDNPYDHTAAGDGSAPVVEATGPTSKGPRRTAMIAVGALVAAGLVGGGGYLAYASFLGGGGPQPESALPASTLAFAKIDLDPSGGQKIDALRFIRKFPDAPADSKKDDADLRKLIFDQLQKDGQFDGLDYAKDVEPWLGKRFGFGLLPGAAEGDEPRVVGVLAVTDEAKAKAGIAKLAGDSDTTCTVQADFAVCSEDQATVDAAVAGTKKASLESSTTFGDDMGALGETGFMSFHVDLDGIRKIVPKEQLGMSGAVAGLDTLQGRYFGALRFDGPALSLVAKGEGLKDNGSAETGTAIGDLPKDTAVAFAMRGMDTSIAKQWSEFEKTLGSTANDFETQTGLQLPEDLQKIFGSSFALAFDGVEGDMPRIAFTTDSKRADLESIASKLGRSGAPPFSFADKSGRTVVALDQAYADEVAKGGGLAGSEVFKDTVPGAEDAQVVLFADMSRLVEKFGSAGDMDADTRKVLDIFRGIGMTATMKGSSADMEVRVTTK